MAGASCLILQKDRVRSPMLSRWVRVLDLKCLKLDLLAPALDPSWPLPPPAPRKTLNTGLLSYRSRKRSVRLSVMGETI
jgi:hypothetical protein